MLFLKKWLFLFVKEKMLCLEVNALFICLLLSKIVCNTEPSIFQIPSLPSQHLNVWIFNLPQTIREEFYALCREKKFSLIRINYKQDNEYVRQRCEEVLNLVESQNTTCLPCWGYETNSTHDCLLYKPTCPGPSLSWASDKTEQMEIFFNSADFGYVRARQKELKYLCEPDDSPSSASLKCTKHMRYCIGRNIYIDFNHLLTLKEPIRYREDILTYGDLGGYGCQLDRVIFEREGDHKSPLMSWFAEVSNFKVLERKEDKRCDVTIMKPTFIMKLDATVNMYHHFCDFVNLYLSFHMNGSFAYDNLIILWDSFPYHSNFASVWKAFTQNQLMNLSQFRGKTVCFRDVMFPLLPRMIYGLYYNMPLVPGCQESGIFRAFNRHLLHHLNLSNSEQLSQDDSIQITFISRNTKYRRVVNENDLIEHLKHRLPGSVKIEIEKVDLGNGMSFEEQAQVSSKSDVLIGVHGAGLTHILLQPDYGVLFELYNCEDTHCYRDLARLRGVHYITWQDDTKLRAVVDPTTNRDRTNLGGAHAKFANYWLDPKEFTRLTLKAIDIVRERKRNFLFQQNNSSEGHTFKYSDNLSLKQVSSKNQGKLEL